MTNVRVVDYGMGNLGSVVNALEAVGASASVARSPADLAHASHIVLPGVGAFPDGMSNLIAEGWIEPLESEVLQNGKPFLGLCLGMQLLATEGDEHQQCDGLGWIPGRVVKLAPAHLEARIPHIGWNDVTKTRDGILFTGLRDSEVFYFAHSFVFEPADEALITGVCDDYGNFPASLEKDNIMGTQFHPEKSQGPGLHVLRNFIRD